MTRDERIAAGWEECWGVFDITQRLWLIALQTSACWSSTPRERLAFSLEDAKANAHVARPGCVPRPFWRRKKPKAPPPLKVGDEVVVRGKVTQLDPGTELDVRVGDVWVSSNLCERVKP